MPRGQQFLIVEDDGATARTVARALRPRPSTIATSAREAIAFLEEHGIAPLILDVKLPDGTGFEVLEHARSCGPFVDALVMSGDASFANRAYESNVHFVWKPVDAKLISAFAIRVEERGRARNIRICAVLDHWTSLYALTPSERDILSAMALDRVVRNDLADRLGKSNDTIKSQARRLLAKTGHGTLPAAVIALLRAAV